MALAWFLTLALYAGPKEIRKYGIVVGYANADHPGRVHTYYAENTNSEDVTLIFVNEYSPSTRTPVTLNKRTKISFDLTFNVFEIQHKGVKRAIEIFRSSSPLSKEDKTPDVKDPPKEAKTPAKKDEQKEDKKNLTNTNNAIVDAKDNNVPEEKAAPIVKDTVVVKIDKKVIDAFCKYLEEKEPYYAISTMSDDSVTVQDHIDNKYPS